MSWFVTLFVMFKVSPLHAPTPLPAAIEPGLFDVPVIVKSPCVHAGFVLSGCVENACTAAVTAVIVTAPALGLLKLPDKATDPPGYKPLADEVWTTTTLDGVVVAALPVPEPAAVQYAYAALPTTMVMIAIASAVFFVMGAGHLAGILVVAYRDLSARKATS